MGNAVLTLGFLMAGSVFACDMQMEACGPIVQPGTVAETAPSTSSGDSQTYPTAAPIPSSQKVS